MSKRSIHSPWAPYEPTPGDPWNLRKVAHLHRRAGFGATRAELLRDLEAGPSTAIDRLFHPPQLATEALEAIDSLRQTARTSSNIELLKVCWLNRIVHGPDPLLEKLTLFWHGHFATSNKKVESVALMDRQNETLRSHALGEFRRTPGSNHRRPGHARLARRRNQQEGKAQRELPPRVPRIVHPGRRPLRGTRRPRGRPGIHRLGRRRIPAVASARRRASRETPRSSTTEPRPSSARPAAWGPADIVRIVLDRPEAAMFLARKLYRFFVSEAGPPARELIEPLAAEIKSQQFAIGPVVEIILRSRHFYSPQVYRQRIKSPVEHTAGLVRMLEIPRPAFNPLALSAACDLQGQELFAPPNVEGWIGGQHWLNSATLLERTNWAVRHHLGPRRKWSLAVRSDGMGSAITRSISTGSRKR